MSITIPLLNYGNFIGRVGEAIVEKYLKENGLIILAKQYELLGARVDFIISNKEEDKDLFNKIRDDNFFDYIRTHPESLIATYQENPKESWQDFRERLKNQNPNASIFWADNNFYNLVPFNEKKYNEIKSHFYLIEVKASIGKFPPKGSNRYTPSQKSMQYYDMVLHVKIEPNIEEGFTGIIHKKDLEKLNSIMESSSN